MFSTPPNRPDSLNSCFVATAERIGSGSPWRVSSGGPRNADEPPESMVCGDLPGFLPARAQERDSRVLRESLIAFPGFCPEIREFPFSSQNVWKFAIFAGIRRNSRFSQFPDFPAAPSWDPGHGPSRFFLFHLPGPFASTLSPLVAGNESETVRKMMPRETGVEVATESLKAWFLGSPRQRPLGVPSRVAPALSEK